MKKIRTLFCCLFLAFILSWTVKAKTPVDRPQASNAEEQEDNWYNASGTIQADSEYVLDPEIPENYIPIPGKDETYMVVDEKGNIKKYRQRMKQKDGSWVWQDVNPDIPDNYVPVKGIKNLYKVMNEDGSTSYMKYIRNEDDTYAFITCDKKGKPLEDKIKGDKIPDNYVHISNNVYAVYNEHGVIIGYKKRKTKKDGSYYWADTKKPKESSKKDSNIVNGGLSKKKTSSQSNVLAAQKKGSNPSVTQTNGSGAKKKNSDGSYTQTESYTETKIKGNYRITYKTTITKKYDSRGNLLSTKKVGPNEISKTKVSGSSSLNAPDKSSVKNRLDEEAARMGAKVSYQTSMETKLLTALNAERQSEGIKALSKTANAYKIAKCRAADMALYDYVDYDSYLYGSLNAMLKKYGIRYETSGMNIWKTTNRDVDGINARFQAVSGSRKTRMSKHASGVGIAVVKKGGYYYICEVFL